MRIVTSSQMKAAEKCAGKSGITALRLMENAGSAAARFIREVFPVSGAFMAVLCGKGNNGGDGFVVARKLYENGANVVVILVYGRPSTPDAAEMLERAEGLRINVLDFGSQPQDCLDAIKASSGLVDAIFGTGFHGDVDSRYAGIFRAVNESSARKFSLDMPSGANSDTGKTGPLCIRADYTISFAAPKTGQYVYPAVEYCGVVQTVNIGIPDCAFTALENAVELLEMKTIAARIPVRKRDSHKGNYGRLSCICGSVGFSGAAWLSATGALRCGAGLITAYVPKDLYAPLAAKFDEVMVFPLESTPQGSLSLGSLAALKEAVSKSSCALIGCGLSRNGETSRLVRELVGSSTCPVVLDADGINAFDGHIDLLRESKADLILTPHPGEMARLLGVSAADIQASRLETASKFARETGVTLVLKGADTVVAAPDGRAFINPTGNPGMAKGGSGDILAGMIASFAAQGMNPCDAACCGVYLHGLAGDRCAQKLSQCGMAPHDMLTEIPLIFREMSR